MKRAWTPSKRTGVFHVRLGCCGGCGDLVDVVLRDRFEGRPRVFECDSPRHAGHRVNPRIVVRGRSYGMSRMML